MSELLVIIQIAGRRCALSAHDVKSVIEIGTITPVPRAPDFIAGITALRSQTLTVIDCRRALGLGAGDAPTDDRAPVVASGGHAYALMVDAICDQRQVVIKSLDTHYRSVEGVAGATILGDGRVALIVDVDSLVSRSLSSATAAAGTSGLAEAA